jgi:hypothetical protein
MVRWTIAEIGTLDECSFAADLTCCVGSFSLMLWLYATRSDQRQVVVKLGEPAGDGWSLALEDYQLWAEIQVAGQSRIVAAADIETASWQMVTLLVDREQERITLMIDDVLRDRRWFPNDIPRSFDRLVVGGYSDPTSPHHDTFGRNQSGWVDDLQFFDHLLPPEAISAFAHRNQGDPCAALRIMPPAPQAPVSVHFDASASHLPGGNIRACLWDFGDGSTALGRQVVHVYRYAGEYVVRLTVLGDNHRQAVHETMLTVSAQSGQSAAECQSRT